MNLNSKCTITLSPCHSKHCCCGPTTTKSTSVGLSAALLFTCDHHPRHFGDLGFRLRHQAFARDKTIRMSDWVARTRDTEGANDGGAGGMVPDGIERTEVQPQALARQAQGYSAETGGSEGEPAAPEGGARMLMAAASGHMDV
eukprot:TRINITY_DN298_c0_g3_i1.p1 TRINITY_DN298_c0_g3~~TRINITY_DN298_c0_g3_i1.p1  ORF type:complete len:143 (-),score=16.41 TRINITY_DN298_c0_g3_i1:9-437(-)